MRALRLPVGMVGMAWPVRAMWVVRGSEDSQDAAQQKAAGEEGH